MRMSFLYEKICQNAKKCVPLQPEFLIIRIFNNLNFTIMSEIESKVKEIIVDKLGVEEENVTP